MDITALNQSTFRADLEELDQCLLDRGFVQRNRFGSIKRASKKWRSYTLHNSPVGVLLNVAELDT
jgi:hypothetical protein